MKTDEYPDLPSVQSPDAVDRMEMTAEEIRQSHLKYEGSVKFIGVCYIIAGLIIVIIGGLFAFIAFVDEESSMSTRILLALLVGTGAFVLVVGLGLGGLKSWTQTPALLISLFGLLGFPVFTIISAYMLYLLFCEKGIEVFSPEYKPIMAETSEMKCEASVVDHVLEALLIVPFGFIITPFGLIVALSGLEGMIGALM